MRRSILSLAAAAAIAGGAAYMLWTEPAEAQEVMLYKTPLCGCCEGYADYLRENGFTVTVKPTHELVTMSREAGIPDDFQGCHLSMIEDYAVSGHVPVGTVRKLLTERPDITGVTLPGMPLGSPGMSGEKQGPFEILEVAKPGEVSGVYARE